MLRKMALACAVLVLAITTLSAFIRLERAAAGCEPWPQCQAAAASSTGAPPALLAPARITHRVAAGAAVLLIVLMLVRVNAGAGLREANAAVLALLALALFLAVLGRMGADSHAPGVVVGNVVAGFALVAVAWRLVGALAQARRAVAGGWWMLAAAAVAVQVAAGALASATGAGGLAAAVHRAAGVPVVGLLLAAAVSAWRRHQRGAAALLASLGVLQAALGLAATAGRPSMLVLAHNAFGATLLALLVALLPARPR
jgi:heme a synthase